MFYLITLKHPHKKKKKKKKKIYIYYKTIMNCFYSYMTPDIVDHSYNAATTLRVSF